MNTSSKKKICFRCTKTKCKVEYERLVFEMTVDPCPKCKDTEFVEVIKKEQETTPDSERRISDYDNYY